MSTIDLSHAFKRPHGPFQGCLKCKVLVVNEPVTYNTDKKSLTVGLGDSSMAAKCICYDIQQFSRFKIGNVLLLRNVIIRPDRTIVVTRNSKSFISGPIEVPEERYDEARVLVNPPEAPYVTLDAIVNSPPKKLLSLKGQIVQEDQEREVLVGQAPTRIKDIYLGDGSHKVKVTLWREACDMEHRPGDYIAITDAITAIHKGETSVSLTSKSKVKAYEAPVVEKIILVEGVGGCNENKEIITNEGDLYSVSGGILERAFGDKDICSELSERAPLQMKLFLRGATVERIELM